MSESFEYELMGNPCVSLDDYKDPDCTTLLEYDSRESYYETIVDRKLRELIGIKYDKSDTKIQGFFLSGHILINKVQYRGVHAINSDMWLYPRIPRTIIADKVIDAFAAKTNVLAVLFESGESICYDCSSLSIPEYTFFRAEFDDDSIKFGDIVVPVSEILQLPRTRI